jgi:hypothetical protein
MGFLVYFEAANLLPRGVHLSASPPLRGWPTCQQSSSMQSPCRSCCAMHRTMPPPYLPEACAPPHHLSLPVRELFAAVLRELDAVSQLLATPSSPTPAELDTSSCCCPLQLQAPRAAGHHCCHAGEASPVLSISKRCTQLYGQL